MACIDQNNNEEKSQQIPLMAGIYRGATVSKQLQLVLAVLISSLCFVVNLSCTIFDRS